jgi:hypothetical protein
MNFNEAGLVGFTGSVQQLDPAFFQARTALPFRRVRDL